MWQRHLCATKPNFSSFPRLNELLDDTENHILNIENEFKELISAHLVSLKDQLSKYFPDISTENWQFKLVLDPFKIDVDILPDYLQEQTIDLKNDSQAKEDFKNKTVEDFWLCYLSINPEVANEAAKLLVQFSSTYLCESGFSALAYIKSKYRARLDVE